MAAKAGAQRSSAAGLVLTLGLVAAVWMSWERLPGLLALWAAFLVAALFAACPVFTGPKDASGQPTAQGAEQAQMLRFRRWRRLQRAVLPNRGWLPNANRNPMSNPLGEALLRMLPGRVQGVARVVRAVLRVLSFVMPTRTASLAGYGAALAVATLPVDAIPTHLWWLNALAAYVCVVGWDQAVRATLDEDDTAPAVDAAAVADALLNVDTRPGAKRSLIAAGTVGVIVGAGVFSGLRVAHLTWLIVPAPAAVVGCAVIAFAVVVHSSFRIQVTAHWRATIAARREWVPRWQGLKQDVRLTDHVEYPGRITVDTFEAPATLGAAGAIAMGPKLEPAVGAGVVFALLPEPNTDAGGSPIPGTVHPVMFRAVVIPTGSAPDVDAADSDVKLLGLWAQVLAANAVRAATGQSATVPLLSVLSRVTAEESERPVWLARWWFPEALSTAASGIESGMHLPSLPADWDGPVVLFGALGEDGTVFENPTMADLIDRMRWESRWKQRWRDVFKTQHRNIPAPQWLAKQEVSFPGGAIIHSAPHMCAQGDEIGLYMSPVVAQKLPTTLNAAPFCTVIGFPNGVEAGGRNPKAFNVLWSDKPLPTDPTVLPANAGDVASKWVLAALVNAGFDAAKLPRPEVARATAMTRSSSEGSIWRVSLRMYGGVTLDAVKRAVPKMRAAFGAPAWLIAAAGEYGCDIFVGAHPNQEGVVFTRPQTRDTCSAAALESAFTEASLDSPDGVGAQLAQIGGMESNPKITRAVFSLPPRRALSEFMESKALDKLRSATGNSFFQIRPDKTDPSRFVALFSELDPMPSPAPFMWELLSRSPREVPFATRVEGAPAVWSLEQDSHLLVLGQNGSGKGIAMTAVVEPMLLNGWDVYACDPIKGFNDFAPFDRWLKFRATSYEDTAAVQKHAVSIMEQRKALNAEYGVSNIRDLPAEVRPPMVAVFIDEFTSLVIPDPVRKPPEGADQMALAEFAQATRINALKTTIGAGVGRGVREGRATGVVFVLAGQKLTADLLKMIPGGGTIKSQFSRLAMGKMSFGDMSSAFHDPVAASGLLSGEVPRGRGVFESTSENPFAVQTWWAGGDQSEHFRQLTTRLAEVREPLAESERFVAPVEASQAPTERVFGRRRDASSGGVQDAIAAAGADDTVVETVLDGDLGLSFGGGELGLDFTSAANTSDVAAPEAAEPTTPPNSSLVPGPVPGLRSSGVLSVTVPTGSGAPMVDELSAQLAADHGVTQLVADGDLEQDWLPGVSVRAALQDIATRYGVEFVARAPREDAAPVPVPTPLPAPVPVPMPTPLPTPVPASDLFDGPATADLFAPPPAPPVQTNPVSFD